MVSISLNNSSLPFFNVYAPLICSSTDNRIDFFPPPFFPPKISSFWWTLVGTQKVLLILVGRKYSIGSSPLTSFFSMTLTRLLFSMAPLLASPLLPPIFAPEKCFRTWLLITYQFYLLSFFLRSFALTNVPLPSIFRKLVGMALPFSLTPIIPLQRNTRHLLFPLMLLSLLFWH